MSAKEIIVSEINQALRDVETPAGRSDGGITASAEWVQDAWEPVDNFVITITNTCDDNWFEEITVIVMDIVRSHASGKVFCKSNPMNDDSEGDEPFEIVIGFNI